MAAARYLVSGKVQGVWFRAGTREQAVALGLRGYARNLPDGRVDVLAVGEQDAIARLESWLHRGTPMAKVESVVQVETEVEEGAVREGFDTA